MANENLFFYFGDDEAYFKAIQGEFKRHARIPIKFLRISEQKEEKIQSLFLRIFREKPAAIFIDFSKLTQDYLHLARIIARTPLEHRPVTIGLVDYLSPPEVLAESNSTGVHLTHIKGPETFDVVFDVMKLISPEATPEHGFATATLNEEYEVGVPAKVGYIHREGLHIETDFALKVGDRIKVKHAWSVSRVVPSREVFVKNISSTNLFYQFKHACDLDFLFVDEFLPPEGMEEDRIQEKRQEREDLIEHHKKLLKRWIDDNMSRSQEKKAKVLVVDREFHFYQNQPRTDKHPYIVRCVPFLEDMGEELDRLHPKVIAFALDKKDESVQRNTHEVLSKLAQLIKVRFAELSPFLVIFNSAISSQEMKNSLGYDNVMATTSELSVDVLVRMADIFEKKMVDVLAAPDEKIDKVFLKKTNTSSICEIMVNIQVMKLSETDMILQSEHEIPPGTNLHFSLPVDMYVNVHPMKSQGKTQLYHGLVHCLGEDQKKELRKYVNTIFFREHDGKKLEELEKFKHLNEEKLKQKIAQEKAEQEEQDGPENSGEES